VSSELIEIMFEELFKLKVNGYTLYAHNLGRFDAIFIIKLLALLDYQVSPIWKDNAILRIKIFDPKTKQRIILLDSLNLFKFSLKNLLISFDIDIKKGEFPHLFVDSNNLNYIGNKPDIKYYALSNISLDDYNKINTSN
jgi:DNA polymerase type B, organellar and viral